MTDPTEELRAAHDVLAEFYAERLAEVLDATPIERAVLGLFTELVRDADSGRQVADVGCGTGRLASFLVTQGLSPHGIDLSPEMIRVARRDTPGVLFELGDVRDLPFEDASIAGAVCWYSLMYLHSDQRAAAYAELARVIRPGGYLTTAFKVGDGTLRRAGTNLGLGIGFDIYWFAADQVEQWLVDAGFRVVFSALRPAGDGEEQPQAYVIAQKS